MLVIVNGHLLPEEEATVSVFDRGYLYGDGLFETIRACSGRLFLGDAHFARLEEGAHAFRIPLPFETSALKGMAIDLLKTNGLREAMVRIHLSRGRGPRGYSIQGSGPATLVMSTHPALGLEVAPPTPWRLVTSRYALPGSNPISRFKNSNKLLHIVARMEAQDAGADEALLLNANGHIAEAASANVFWFQEDRCCTPSLMAGGLPGITRAWVMDHLARQGCPVAEVLAGPEALHSATGAFLTLSGTGVIEIRSLDHHELARDARIQDVRAEYRGAVLAGVGESSKDSD